MTTRPGMCRKCGKIMGLETTCPWCGAKDSARAPRHAVRSMGGHGGAVASFLTGAIFLIYAASLLVGGIREGGGLFGGLGPATDFLNNAGMMNNHGVAAGEWWRLVAAIFLHLGLLHVAFNGMALWQIGRPLEDDVGGSAFWVFFLVSGVAGFALGLLFDNVNTAGASGSISGLIGAVIARQRVSDGHFDSPGTRLALRYAVSTAVFGLAVPGINNVAHGGGFLAGALLGALYSWGEGHRFALPLWRAGAIASAAFAIAAAAAMAMAGPQIQGDDVLRMDACIREVSNALAGMEPGSPTTLTARLDPCLDDRAIFEGEPAAKEAIIAMDKAVRATHAALAGGLRREITAATEELLRARAAWVRWVNPNLARFGLRLSDDDGP